MLKQVVNETQQADLNRPAARVRQPYRCSVFSIGALAPGVDLRQANQLAATLKDELRFHNPLNQ